MIAPGMALLVLPVAPALKTGTWALAVSPCKAEEGYGLTEGSDRDAHFYAAISEEARLPVGETRDTEATIEEFLLEMSDVESVEAGRAAEHARDVAETLRSGADASHRERLRVESKTRSCLP